MKLISWNVNGIRAAMKKGFLDFVREADPDILCIQETKMQEGQAEVPLEGYHQYWFSAEKKGYSGTLIYAKNQPNSVVYGIHGKHNEEGRVITLEYDNFYFVNAYVPNAQDGLKRIDYRVEFENDMRNYLVELDKQKPVVYCGDLNVAHQEIDLKNPKSNHKSAGFSDEEREKFTRLLSCGFADSYRRLYPDKVEYSWWSYMMKAREKNVGWRIDYFVLSERLMEKVKDSYILTSVMGSDHCPVGLEIAL